MDHLSRRYLPVHQTAHMGAVRPIDSDHDADLIEVHDALSSVVETPFPARGKMLIDESLTTVGISSIRLESGHCPPARKSTQKHRMLAKTVRDRRVVFPGCPSGHPGGKGESTCPRSSGATELFTKHPPVQQPPSRVRAVDFRVLDEQLTPELWR